MRASDDSNSRASLRGVKAFHVLVENITDAPPEVTRDDFQTDVELRCRQAGIRLEDAPGTYLYVAITLQELKYANGQSEGAYAFSVAVEFNQPVLLLRDPTIRVIAPTWFKHSTGVVELRDLRTFLRRSVSDKVENFLNAFLEQNPK
jgi:hypothetical protein